MTNVLFHYKNWKNILHRKGRVHHILKGTVSRDFLLQIFFHESSSPKPLKIILGAFWISSKFAEIFASQGAYVSTTPVVHLELRISPRIFNKIRNGPNGIVRGLGETDKCRKRLQVTIGLYYVTTDFVGGQPLLFSLASSRVSAGWLTWSTSCAN